MKDRSQRDKSCRCPAAFLDRDGTLIEDRGHVRSAEEVVFFPGAFSALRRLQEHFLLFIVTNQPGVARGALTIDDVKQVNDYIVAQLAARGVRITNIYWCPHDRFGRCVCIKPSPFLLQRAAERHHVDLQQSFVIGDHPEDLALAENAGARGVYVLTGHGREHRHQLTGDPVVVCDIVQAADWIMKQRTIA